MSRIITRGTRQAGLGMMLLLSVAACAHRIHPTPPPQTPAPAAAPLLFTATAYCTGRLTATGAIVGPGVVAADPAVLPLGTIIRITGAAPYDGTYRVLDTGGLIRNRHVDLYIPNCAAARRFGRRSVRVRVIHDMR